MTKGLCINCGIEPIYIQKRKLCMKCYQKKYKEIRSKVVTWPVEEAEVEQDIKAGVKKHPKYKQYIKEQVEEVVKNLCV